MKSIDLHYLCTTIANLAGVPVRIYQNGFQTFYHSLVSLPKDPVTLYEQEILALRTPVGYFITPGFDYYGFAVTGDTTIVIGPARLTPPTEQELRKLAFDLSVEPDAIEKFLSSMKVIINMPLESILQILCMIYHVITGEKISLNDLEITDSVQKKLSAEYLFLLSLTMKVWTGYLKEPERL